MAAVNPQPLQARPYEETMGPPIQIEDNDDGGEYEDGDSIDYVKILLLD